LEARRNRKKHQELIEKEKKSKEAGNVEEEKEKE
jgi:hypothetical protein